MVHPSAGPGCPRSLYALELAVDLKLCGCQPKPHTFIPFNSSGSFSLTSYTRHTQLPPQLFLGEPDDADARLIQFLQQWQIGPGGSCLHGEDSDSDDEPGCVCCGGRVFAPRWMLVHKLLVHAESM